MVSEAYGEVLRMMKPHLNQVANLLCDILTHLEDYIHCGGIFIPNKNLILKYHISA